MATASQVVSVAIGTVEQEIAALTRWLDELDVLRDGVALALAHRQVARDSARFPTVRVMVTDEVTPTLRRRRKRSVTVIRRPKVPATGQISWWATTPATGFTEAALRDHAARWSQDAIAQSVDGAAIS